MSDRQQLAEHGTNFCIAALGIIAGGVTVATALLPIAVLTMIGYEKWEACDATTVRRARKAAAEALRQSTDITEADITTAAAILSKRRDRIRFEPERMSRAVASGDVEAALLRDVFGDTLRDLDPGPRRAINVTLRTAFDIFRENPKYRDVFTQAMVMDLLRAHKIDHSLLESIKDDTTTIREDVKDLKTLLQSLGGFQNAAANAETLALQDLKTLARAFNETALTDRAALIEFLTQKAEEYRSYRATIDALDDRVAAIANLKGAAQDAAAKLDFDEVEALLSRVDEVETEIAAETKVARAKNALLRNDPDSAFRLLSAAADSFGSVDTLKPANQRLEYGTLLYEHGLRYAGPALYLAARMREAALASTTRDDAPELWAALQNNLGNALGDLGARAGDTDALQDAVTAYRAALEVRTREASPMGWAATQNNLGNALGDLGARAGDTDALQDAVTAYRAALEVRTREASPMGWAATQNNLGTALQTLGARAGDTDALQDAVTAFRAALEVYTREASPMDWAMTQNNLGTALQTLGARAGDTAALQDAVTAYRAALEVRSREASPMGWAMTQNNLGNALANLGARAGDTDALQHAVTAYRAALEVRTREASPMDWAMTQNNLGNALVNLGARVGDTDALEDAVTAYRAALEVFTREASPMHWAMTQNNLGNALQSLGARAGDTGALQDAVTAYRAALEVRTREAAPFPFAETKANLARAQLGSASLPDAPDRANDLAAALQAVDAALSIFTPEHTPYHHEKATHLRDQILAAMNDTP
jgi:hypothetical protein